MWCDSGDLANGQELMTFLKKGKQDSGTGGNGLRELIILSTPGLNIILIAIRAYLKATPDLFKADQILAYIKTLVGISTHAYLKPFPFLSVP